MLLFIKLLEQRSAIRKNLYLCHFILFHSRTPVPGRCLMLSLTHANSIVGLCIEPVIYANKSQVPSDLTNLVGTACVRTLKNSGSEAAFIHYY